MDAHLKLPVALAVDDEPQVLKLIVQGLSNRGFTVLSAHSRAEAEEIAEGLEHIDALVTDIFLGDGWGGELAFRLKERHPRMAVVFISGLVAEDPILRHGIQDHMIFLEKPFTLVELAEAVEVALRKAPGHLRREPGT